MTIKTKFKPGDTVFFMHENKVAQSSVTSIVVAAHMPDDPTRSPLSITVHVVKPFNPKATFTGFEQEFFATKEELIASL